MKNFDEERDARRNLQGEQFQIGGETFTVNSAVNPNVLLAFDAIDESSTGIAETLAIVDATIKGMIVDADGTEGGSHARYDALRARTDDPITVGDLVNLATWLIGAQAGRPTGPPSDSSDGRGTTGTSSTGTSSSPVSPEAQPV